MTGHISVVPSLQAMALPFPSVPRGLSLTDHHEPLDARSGLLCQCEGDVALLVLEGELSVMTPDEQITLGAGTAMRIGRGVLFGWRVASLAAHFVTLSADSEVAG